MAMLERVAAMEKPMEQMARTYCGLVLVRENKSGEDDRGLCTSVS